MLGCRTSLSFGLVNCLTKRRNKMIVEHGKFNVYFRIPFFIYFIAKEKDCPVFCLVKKVFNAETGLYRWVKI